MAAPAARAPAARAARRDALAEQQLVRDLWQQVEARLDSSGALRAFLTQKIDDCGQTVAFEAFDLVRQVLNPEGFVRRAHKSADQNLGAAITMPESPWTAEGSVVDRQWDFNNAWMGGRRHWPGVDGHMKVQKGTVATFCTVDDSIPVVARNQKATYVDGDKHDDALSMPKLDNDLKNIPILQDLSDDVVGHPIRRWETFVSTLPSEAWEEVLANGLPYNSVAVVSTKLKKFEIVKKLWDDYGVVASVSSKKTDLEAILRMNQNNGALLPGVAKTYNNATELADARQALETYWKVALRSRDWASHKVFKDYYYEKKHAICTFIDKPDLILEVAYFCTDTGLFKKKVIFCEVDGDDKTARPTSNFKDKEDADDEEEPESKKTQKMDPLKLAYKLMSSTNSQLSLHPDTYHIRSNWTVYQDHAIARSLMETTGIELPEFADLIATYQKNSQDYEILHRAIHLVHHMFIAHVKIAFLIYMQVVHDIDMRSLDTQDKQMQNHCFFVNFDASHIPDTLVFEEKMPRMTRAWMEERLMMHTRIGINTFNTSSSENEWKVAPVLRADSSRSAMQDWNARVSSASLPLFPFEKRTSVSVTCATIQRVNMKRLIQLVQAASSEACDAYYDAVKLKPHKITRITVDSVKIDVKEIKRRQFPDRCFLTRKEQYDRNAMWNKYPAKLRCRRASKNNDLLEFSWGYEDPTVRRTFTGFQDPDDADETIWRQWDQVDVRMYYFDIAMKKQKDWVDTLNGMWYLQDYIDFFDALRKLAIQNAPVSTNFFTCLDDIPNVVGLSVAQAADTYDDYDEKMLALSKYAFLISKKKGALKVEKVPARDLHDWYQTLPNKSNLDNSTQSMPQQSTSENRAYHIFSILSWFFDCRDGGACRWRWEDYLLDYFGANKAGDSPFDEFHFSQKQSQESGVSYFNQPWFQMTFFMELNFRNAIAQMHCQLFESSAHTQKIAGDGLQKKAKELYNRQHSLLNTRARCLGPQGVSAGLSWRKSSERNCLRNLLLSSLDDTLPGLDPQLEVYLRQFNAPNAGLFLRTIEVSNVLALRELALQHKLASQTSPAESKLEARLAWFEPAVQSEIRHLMHCVERDDSVFTAAPVVHPTKAIVLEEELMRKWVRQTLGVHQHLHSLRCPLDVKFHMFTSPETYRVFMQLFCTKTQLDNSHTQRPVLFVLLQVHLAAEVLKGARQEYDALVPLVADTAVNKVQRTNNALELLNVGLGLAQEQCHRKYDIDIIAGAGYVPCTPGSSLATWPLRDQNLWCKPERDAATKVVQYAGLDAASHDIDAEGLEFQRDPAQIEMLLKYQDEEHQITRGMADEELRRWLLLACARPVPCQYERQDDGRYTAGEKKHEFTMQDCAVRQQAEWPHASSTGRQRDTMIAGVSCFEVSAAHRLEVCLCDDADTYIFFETVEEPSNEAPEAFPQYIQDIITDVPHRNLIYVPPVFASHLRKEPIHNKVYTHAGRFWRMACVGYRAWAWKRLLVKSIFFDALTKVVTRSSVLLSLLQNPVDSDDPIAQQRQNQLYRDMLADTKDTFGALELKADKMKENLEEKKIQLILTVFRKNTRHVEIEGRLINIHDRYESVKVLAAERQASWCQFYSNNPIEDTTSRFMSVDKRIQQVLLPNATPHALKDEDVFQYRSYLYIISEPSEHSKHSVVSFKGKLYVKFPSNYSILQWAGGFHTGEVKSKFQATYFATCWDCRRYSCLKPDYLLPPDSASTIRILAAHAQPDALSQTINTPANWPSTPHDDLEACKYICLDTANLGRAHFVNITTPFIDHSAHSIIGQKQEHMFTLPDIFRDNEIDPDVMPHIPKVDDWNDVKFKDELKPMISLDEKCKLWNKLRNSSRYIATQHKQDPKDPKNIIVEQVLDTGDVSFKGPFTEIMATLRRRILPKTNEDT